MSLSRIRNIKNDNLTWPGFVDALAALLMVVIFVLMIFSIAQFYLNQIVSGQDEALFDLNKEINSLYNLLQIEKDQNSDLKNQINIINIQLENANNEITIKKNENDALSQLISSLEISLKEKEKEIDNIKEELTNKSQILEVRNNELNSEKDRNQKEISNYENRLGELENQLNLSRNELAVKIDDILKLEKLKSNLQIEIENIISNNKEINADLLQERDYSKTLEEKIASLKDKAILEQTKNAKSSEEIIKLRSQINLLRTALSEVNLKLSQLQALFEKQKVEDQKKKIETANLGKELNSALASRVKELQKFRSEFFGRLSELLETRDEIRIVGDRFVFQSEVLFEKGSANLGFSGNEQLKKLYLTLDEIAETIPQDINWVLQVEGHTDSIPITAGRFKDNWDLSTERALSVVRFLIDQGIDPQRLSATGYGEFQPLQNLDTDLSQEQKNSKNRRIELKLTQRIVD